MNIVIQFCAFGNQPHPPVNNSADKVKVQEAFKALHAELFAVIDKQADTIESDMHAINALAAQDEYPEKEICEALQTLYAHVHSMKLNVAILDELLDDAPDEVIKSADFMDEYIDIIVSAMHFIDDAESELDELLLGI